MRCRVGDLAVIVGGAIVENHGHFVTVREWDDARGVWMVDSEGSALLSGRGNRVMSGLICDRNLRPIRPDADPVSTDTTREVTA